MPGHRNDPTRNAPAGSRTETRIAEESELGSDNAEGEREPKSSGEERSPEDPKTK